MFLLNNLLCKINTTSIFISIIFIPLFLFADNTNKTENPSTKEEIQIIKNKEEFTKILDENKDKLLMFDLYADWCMPCHILSPMLAKIAIEKKDRVRVYKINIDKNPDIAQAFGVSGIPYVVFVKNKKAVHAMTGVMPKAAYIRAINQFSQNTPNDEDITPDGKIVEGIRVITLTTSTSPDKIYVYRGEKVKIVFKKIDIPYSVHIPEYKISKTAELGNDLEISFKAKNIGVFPMYCNGKCPNGDGSNFGQIVVMQYKAEGDAEFKELTAKEAKKLIEKEKPLILDVRTPNEYHQGHIKNSLLIPLHQLENRLSEIEKYKNKKILVYCRSGNRSTVASEILIQNRFKKLYNLRHGITGWVREGFEIQK